jgi:predicted O-methyltransferase YrrM
MLDGVQLAELREGVRADDFLMSLLSERGRRVVEEIIDHDAFPGSTDPAALAVVAALVRTVRPTRMLQLGTHIGFSAVYLGDVLAPDGGHLVTVEPDVVALGIARKFVDDAGLADSVQFIEGFSTDDPVHARLRREGPFDLVYLDSSHAYAATLVELELIFDGAWLAKDGLLILHDAARMAAAFDPTGEGGVPRALDEWVKARPDDVQSFVLEPPLWPCACGLGLVTRLAARTR